MKWPKWKKSIQRVSLLLGPFGRFSYHRFPLRVFYFFHSNKRKDLCLLSFYVTLCSVLSLLSTRETSEQGIRPSRVCVSVLSLITLQTWFYYSFAREITALLVVKGHLLFL